MNINTDNLYPLQENAIQYIENPRPLAVRLRPRMRESSYSNEMATIQQRCQIIFDEFIQIPSPQKAIMEHARQFGYNFTAEPPRDPLPRWIYKEYANR